MKYDVILRSQILSNSDRVDIIAGEQAKATGLEFLIKRLFGKPTFRTLKEDRLRVYCPNGEEYDISAERLILPKYKTGPVAIVGVHEASLFDDECIPAKEGWNKLDVQLEVAGKRGTYLTTVLYSNEKNHITITSYGIGFWQDEVGIAELTTKSI